MDSYHFGVEVDLSPYHFLRAALNSAETTAPQPIKELPQHKTPAEKLCVAVLEGQMVLGDAKSCRYLASAGTALCRGIFVRNPKTSATVVAHLHPGSREDDFLKAIELVAGPGSDKEVDLYIMGGQNKKEFFREEDYLKFYDPATTNDVEKSINNLDYILSEAGVRINYKVINLFNAKTTPNAVLDTVTGDFFYVDNGVLDAYTPVQRGAMDELDERALKTVFNGLKMAREKD